MMPKTIAFGSAAALFVLVVVIVTWKRIAAGRDANEYQEQLRLARAEGLPTNWVEFAATIRPAKPAENAAKFYRQLQPLMKSLGDPQTADVSLLANPSPKSLALAKNLVRSAKGVYALLDAATEKSRCWFDRDWSKGAAVLLPEFAQMKTGVRFLALRGSISAAEGRAPEALKDAAKILVVSEHAGEEGTGISALVAEAIYFLDLREVATWCVQHPGVAAYREALEAAVKAVPKPDLRRENRDRLWMMLELIDKSLTPQGQTDLGLRPEEVGSGSTLASTFMSQPRARIALVQADRDYWAALKLPQSEMSRAVSEALSREESELQAFPVAAKVKQMLWPDNAPDAPLQICKTAQVAYAAVLRALSNAKVARTIQSSDLRSPYDNSPLKYEFDGRQMQITVNRSAELGTFKLTIPPKPRSGPPGSSTALASP